MSTLPFFTRNNLTSLHQTLCDNIARALYPNHNVAVHEHQGYCSYTLQLTPNPGPASPFAVAAAEQAADIGRVRRMRRANEEKEAAVVRKSFMQQRRRRRHPEEPLILQFRPQQYGLDTRVTDAASSTYRSFAPRVEDLGPMHLYSGSPPNSAGEAQHGAASASPASLTTPTDPADPSGTLDLHIYALTLIPGIPYSVLQVKRPHLTDAEMARQVRLVRGFAAFMACGWPSSSPSSPPRPLPTTPPPSPSSSRPSSLSPSPFLSSPRSPPPLPSPPPVPLLLHRYPTRPPLHIHTPSKLRLLSTSLPSASLRRIAQQTQQQLPLLSALPLALSHGDVLPGNMIVDPSTGELRGLVDWAEAETMRWGVGLYGVEFLVGFVDEDAGAFVYYDLADELRAVFWRELEARIGAPMRDARVREAVEVVRRVGVLLWFGFAWDEGRIDRVVNERDDPREVMLLETFLGLRGNVVSRL